MWARVGSAWQRLFSGGCEDGSSQPDPESGVSGVVAEASAILLGRAADAYVCEGWTLPYWAWLNALAHRPPSALRAVATAYPWGSLTAKTIAIADQLDLVSPEQASAIQAGLLVPAELAALSRAGGRPDDLVRRVRGHVTQMCRYNAARR